MTTFRRAAVLAAAFALFTSSNLYAIGATYSEKGFYCTQAAGGGGSLVVGWPSLTGSSTTSMTYTENVYFSAVVYRFNETTRVYDPYRFVPTSTAPSIVATWYVGMANGYGPVPYTMILGDLIYWKLNGSYSLNPTIGLPRGYYAVREFYQWQSGKYADTWATLVQPGYFKVIPVGVKGGYCTIY